MVDYYIRMLAIEECPILEISALVELQREKVFPEWFQKEKQLGVTSGETFIVSSLCPSIPSNDDEPNDVSTTTAEKKKKVVRVRTYEQRKPWAGVIGTDKEYHKKVHSSKMELVWKEAEPKPKVRSKSNAPQRRPFTPLYDNVDSVGLGTKAGKWSYKVLVGKVDNL
jgi:hypothetical protein